MKFSKRHTNDFMDPESYKAKHIGDVVNNVCKDIEKTYGIPIYSALHLKCLECNQPLNFFDNLEQNKQVFFCENNECIMYKQFVVIPKKNYN